MVFAVSMDGWGVSRRPVVQGIDRMEIVNLPSCGSASAGVLSGSSVSGGGCLWNGTSVFCVPAATMAGTSWG